MKTVRYYDDYGNEVTEEIAKIQKKADENELLRTTIREMGKQIDQLTDKKAEAKSKKSS